MFVKKKRNDIYDLLTKKGYERIHENLSAQDDWYVPKKQINLIFTYGR